MNPTTSRVIAGFLALASFATYAEDAAYSLRAQSTFVVQRKPSFSAAYSGPNSLRPELEISRSWTATVFAGWKPRDGTEVYLNPEVAAGVPLSNLTGLGGLTNGELARTSGPDPIVYRARAFVRQTFGLGGGREQIEADDNQIATTVDRDRIVITAGNLSALDVFDDSTYAKDPRTQFMNWSLFAPGAWDYPADARGYTWGFAIEYIGAKWSLRAGRFLMPRESNGRRLNYRIGRSAGDVIEFERPHSWGGAAGAVRLLAFRNQAQMGGFRAALDQAQGTGTTPDLAATDQLRRKVGFAVNIEQSLAPGIGAFTRLSWGDGKTETFAFTEIDRSYTAGVVLDGRRWHRARDTVGIALVRNELARDRRDYLAAGGLGFFLGDGRLTYKPEWIAEAYYSVSLREMRPAAVWLSFNIQRILHPGYNADRGPVMVYGVRIHTSF